MPGLERKEKTMPEILERTAEERQASYPFKEGKVYPFRMITFGLSEYKGEVSQFNIDMQTVQEFEIGDKKENKKLVLRFYKPSCNIPAPKRESSDFVNTRLGDFSKAVPEVWSLMRSAVPFTDKSLSWKVTTRDECAKIVEACFSGIDEPVEEKDPEELKGMRCKWYVDGPIVNCLIQYDQNGYPRIEKIYKAEFDKEGNVLPF